MTDYDALVKALRICSSWCTAECQYRARAVHTCRNDIVRDAADAIEELNKQVEDYECRLEISPEAEYAIDKHCDDIISRMDKLIKGLDDKPRWIPVTERLPKKYHQVLVYGLNGMQIDYYAGEKSIGGRPLFMISEAKVTHWQPLPKPPKHKCNRCHGKGYIEAAIGVPGDPDSFPCPDCNGTGIVPKEET